MDIKSFTHSGGQGGQAGGIIRSEKWENHKNSTHIKIQFYIISNEFFFLWWILQFLPIGGVQGAGMGHYPFIKMRKSQEQYPY